MTSTPDDLTAAVADVVEALRSFEAVADALAGPGAAASVSDAVGSGAVESGAVGADAVGADAVQLRVQALAHLGAVKAAFERTAVRQVAALERTCALNPQADPQTGAMPGGHRDTASLLAELWRTSLGNARQLCDVARATAPRYTLQGEELPPEFPALAEALLGGSVVGTDPDPDGDREAGSPVPGISMEHVAVVARELGKTGSGCSYEDRCLGERLLVEHAPGFTVEELRRLAVKVRDRLDADGTEPREQVQRRRRSLTITTTRDGMTHIDWYLDPESAGHVVPQITAYVSGDFHDTRNSKDPRDGTAADAEPAHATTHAGVRFEDPEPETTPESPESPESPQSSGSPEMPETRSMAQLRSDGAVEVFRHRAGCTTGATSPPVTMIVRVSLADLKSGKGAAEVDEAASPISAATARRLAADARLIPMVLGRHSEVLDLGRKQRLFSPAQKHALAERDGGCAWTGCPHPPSYTQAHHIRWWNRDTGPTDLKNGILLCSHHHHRVHDDGWDITVRDHIPWFTPPAHLDPTRTPRRGGRIRLPESAPP
jgi:hypothetical protein